MGGCGIDRESLTPSQEESLGLGFRPSLFVSLAKIALFGEKHNMRIKLLSDRVVIFVRIQLHSYGVALFEGSPIRYSSAMLLFFCLFVVVFFVVVFFFFGGGGGQKQHIQLKTLTFALV